jgi:hypothetical protein
MQTHLADHPACQKDLSALAPLCKLTADEMKNDFAALVCVQQRPPEQFEAVSETCEQVSILPKSYKYLQPGTGVMILKIFSPKKLQKIGVFD